MVDLGSLAPPNDRRLAVRVTPDALRHVRAGHPWVFESSITSLSHAGRAGDLAVIFDDRRRFTAIGLYDPASPIRVKVLHRGQPTPIDEDFWRERIDTSFARRRPLVESGDTTAYRCIHGENDAMPGLVLDRYESTYVLKLYSAAWLPHLATVQRVLQDRVDVDAIVLRLSRAVSAQETFGLADGVALIGRTPREPVRFRENGLVFEASVVEGHKTGHFLDQRDNRARVRALSSGARVLDVFSYTGGFSLHAAAGGATSVHSVDASAPALDTAARNFAHNRGDERVRRCHHTSTAGDAFAVMRELTARGEHYDVLIIDPPSFAQRQADVAAGLRAYRQLTELGLGLVRRGGILVQSSCSSRISSEQFHEAVLDATRACGGRIDELERTAHALDHPIGFPEGAYLKTVFARVAAPGR
jgi:23S rRNA (cytosine1962-C5)-methyltransferase